MPSDGQQIPLDDIAEDSPFVRLLETKARVKLLDVMLRHSYSPMSEEALAERADLNQSTVNRNIQIFVDLDIVERREGWPAKYAVDTDSPVVQGLKQAKRDLLTYIDRLEEEDVDRLEDHEHWNPLTNLRDPEIRTMIEELRTRLNSHTERLPPGRDEISWEHNTEPVANRV